MQAMAAAQAAAAEAGGGGDAFPFSTLSVWRSKVQQDLAAAGDKGGPRYKLRLLLEQGRDVEQGVMGCLKDALFELHEGVAWGLLDSSFEKQQRQQLVNAAANELASDKLLMVELAREHGVLEGYTTQLKKPTHRSLADYERVGELKFGLLVWRANLKRDISLLVGAAGDPLELQAHLHAAYSDALRLIQRCGTKSLQFWAAQQAGGAPTHGSKQRLYQAAVQRVQNALLELAAAHPMVESEGLKRLFGELSDPDAVPLAEQEEKEGEEEEEAAAAADDAGGDEGAVAYVRGGGGGAGRRASSEESETSALGCECEAVPARKL